VGAKSAEVCPGLAHQTVRCATGQCPVQQRTPSSTLHLREFSEALHYNSPDCLVYHRTVFGAPGRSDSEIGSFGNLLRYNSPDCPVCQRSNGSFRANGHLLQHLLRARARRNQARARRCTGQFIGPVRCTTGLFGGPEDFSSNGQNPMAT
jgi:hypothetical protein